MLVYEYEHMSTRPLKDEELRSLLKSKIVQKNHAIIRALAGLTRFRIITLLKNRPPGLTVSRLAVILDASPSKVSHQLRILRNFELVSGEQNGKSITYRLNTKEIRRFFLNGQFS